jgi:hypothetical protein
LCLFGLDTAKLFHVNFIINLGIISIAKRVLGGFGIQSVLMEGLTKSKFKVKLVHVKTI